MRNFQDFEYKNAKNTLEIRKAQNNLNEFKVNVSLCHLHYEESLKALTCVI